MPEVDFARSHKDQKILARAETPSSLKASPRRIARFGIHYIINELNALIELSEELLP